MRHSLIVSLLFGVALACASCANYTAPLSTEVPKGSAEANFNAVWSAAMDVLDDYRFRVDRHDRRAGVITTRPMLARHWFEFWRHDTVGWADFAECSLQTRYRIARVLITELPSRPGRYQAAVSVEVLAPPGHRREVVSTGDAYDQFQDTIDFDPEERRKRSKKTERRRQKLEEVGIDPDSAFLPTEGPDSWLVSLGPHEALADKISGQIRQLAKERLAE